MRIITITKLKLLSDLNIYSDKLERVDKSKLPHFFKRVLTKYYISKLAKINNNIEYIKTYIKNDD